MCSVSATVSGAFASGCGPIEAESAAGTSLAAPPPPPSPPAAPPPCRAPRDPPRARASRMDRWWVSGCQPQGQPPMAEAPRRIPSFGTPPHSPSAPRREWDPVAVLFPSNCSLRCQPSGKAPPRRGQGPAPTGGAGHAPLRTRRRGARVPRRRRRRRRPPAPPPAVCISLPLRWRASSSGLLSSTCAFERE